MLFPEHFKGLKFFFFSFLFVCAKQTQGFNIISVHNEADSFWQIKFA